MRRRNRVMVFVGILVVLVGAIIIYWNIPYSPYKSAFTNRMMSRVDKISESDEIYTREDVEKLPKLLQKYCNYIGLENFKKHQVAHVDFRNTKFVFDTKSGKTIDMDYDLWLYYDQPYRSAYCTSSIKGIPFDGQDYCTEDKQGGMKGYLGKIIQIFDQHNEQGYKAGLISWIAESATLNPAVIFSPYISYEEIDDTHLRATINYNGVSGTGIFTFNDEGAITEFYSDERQEEEVDGVMTKLGWRCEYGNYEKNGDILQSTNVRSIKVLPDGKEIVYFDSDNFTVTYLK